MIRSVGVPAIDERIRQANEATGALIRSSASSMMVWVSCLLRREISIRELQMTRLKNAVTRR